MTGPCHPEQLIWQKRACKVLADLLDTQAREILPVLSWTVADAGAVLTGRSGVYATGRRRDAITAWAEELGIPLHEYRSGPGVTTVSGVAQQRETPHGACTIVLTCDVYDEGDGDDA